MNAQLTEIMRLITNLIRTGVVTEVDRENWLCRVKTGDLETNWINWLTLRAGDARTWWKPSEGEQVVLLSLGGNLETAFALPAIYSNQFAPPSTSADACVTEHPDGGWFEYEPATGRWYVRGIKSMVIEAADNITMKTSEFVLEADRTRINSDVVINGGVTGTPTAPTAAQSVNNTQIATTAFVKSAIAAMVGSAPAALDTLNELAAALGNDPNFATTMLNALAGKQPLDNTLTNLSGKDVAGLLTYLGLGEAAKRNVGNGQNQIPDMAAFASSLSSTGFQKLPSGLIIQWGIVSGASNYTVTYPVTFPNRSLALLAVPHTTSVAGISAMGIANCSDISKSQFYIIVGGISQGEIVKYERSCFWVAIGV
ncbi:phage baseplate assembly protein V [Escherichia coli]|uniref:phage baseplate assembly protein V n=1 Tax=Escherichia coli TaxID=562 RepID=UPI000C8213C5|nr:phage baseplate assembly protein V [Escherichia coli]